MGQIIIFLNNDFELTMNFREMFVWGFAKNGNRANKVI